MCSVCGKSPCDFRCPNAPDAIPRRKCIECGEGLWSGDEYFESDKGPICLWCMKHKSLRELLETMGESLSTV